MTQRERMVAALSERPGLIMRLDAVADAIWSHRAVRPLFWESALGAIASQCRRKGHRVERAGEGYRLAA